MKDTFENRIKNWHEIRTKIETSDTPFDDVIEYWRSTKTTSRLVDPYDSSTWPSPWEMMDENRYCIFTKLLAVAYTIGLTTRFANSKLQIVITKNITNKNIEYILKVDDVSIEINDFHDEICIVDDLPTDWQIQKIHDIHLEY